MGVEELAVLMEKSYIEFCHREYFAGWDAQNKGKEIPEGASEMWRSGWSDSYEYGEVMGSLSYE